MRGRKPVPLAQKILRGNPGHRPLNKAEPKFTGTVKCPSWLTKEAKAEWKRVVAAVAEIDMLRATDQQQLAAYCEAYGRWVTAEAIVTAEGQTVKEPVTNKAGEVIGHKIKRHPATIIAKDERAAMLKAASLFGFDPSSRSRVQVPEEKEAPEHDNFDDNLFADPQNTSGVVH